MFRFHITASATPLTRDEFIAQQTASAEGLRSAILADTTASQALQVLASDPVAWDSLYLMALAQAGLLRAVDVPPTVREDPTVISLMATLSAGILAGPAGQQIISNGDLPSFFAQARKWYGNNDALLGSGGVPDAGLFDLHESRRTVFEAFNIYVPFGKVTFDPGLIDAPPPEFLQFLQSLTDGGHQATVIGPLGYGTQQFLPKDQALPYTIRFQNPSTASSVPTELRIVTQLDPNIDPRTFVLGDMQIGDISIHLPVSRGVFQGDFDFRNAKGFILRVTAGVDVQSNVVSWLFQAIDPDPGEVMNTGLSGLLPPNDASDAGVGFVTYSATPRTGLATGTHISAQARVISNTSAPEDTLVLDQVIDGAAPATTLTATLLSPGSADYLVKWNAVDDAGGSGVKGVTVYVSEDGGDFAIWLQQSTDSQGIYNGQLGHTYQFLALATDLAGNREQPPLGTSTPDDGSGANLGGLPSVDATSQDLGPPADASPSPSTNPIFTQTQNQVPATAPLTRPPEFTTVFRPFTAQSFATGITPSHAGIASMAILPMPDGSVIASGGLNRGSLYRFGAEGGPAGNPVTTLPYPIFDVALDSQGHIWAATGGGPLLEIDAATLAIVGQFGDSITQTVAIHPTTGEIHVSSGDGIEIFNPTTSTFRHYSDLRVGNMAFSPAGELWAAVWPQRGDIVRFDNKADFHVMLHFASPVDSLAFGLPGTTLDGLLFVSNNAGSRRTAPTELIMVDLATLHTVPVARGGTRGDIVRTTSRGQVLLSESHDIDVLSPLLAPHVVSVNPPDLALAALPLTSIAISFDRDMLADTPDDDNSVLNPANYAITGSAGTSVGIASISYDPATRTAILSFQTPEPDQFTIHVSQQIESAESLPLETDFTSHFTAISDFSSIVRLEFFNSRSDRANGTVAYDVRVTNISTNDLRVPLTLVLDPVSFFAGQPIGALPGNNGLFLLDIGTDLAGGVFKPNQVTTTRTITIPNPAGGRANFGYGVFALPTANVAPTIDSVPPQNATAGLPFSYQVAAHDPDGTIITYFLYAAPDGMTIDPATGLIRWTPTLASPEQANVILRVYDGRGGYAEQVFTLAVAGVNRAPQVSSGPTTVDGREGQLLELVLNATDPDGDPLIYWADNLPPGAVFDPAQHVLQWTPAFDAAGTYPDVRLFVSDGLHDVSRSFTLIIAPGNQAPTLTRPADRTVREGDLVRIQLAAHDFEGDPLSFSSLKLPSGATLHPTTGVFEWTPAFTQHGVYEIPFTVSDGKHSKTQTTTITVLNVNAPPTFEAMGSFQAFEGQRLAIQTFAFDPDNPLFDPPAPGLVGNVDPDAVLPSVSYTVTGLPRAPHLIRRRL